MTLPLHIQTTMMAAPDQVFAALTEARHLTAWFCEHAEIIQAERRFDFWGRYTPETPDREGGRHQIVHWETNRSLSFRWRIFGAESTVEIFLRPDGAGTQVVVRQHGKAYEDFWFLSLENLRRHLDGRTQPVRCDFSKMQPGDIRHSVEINGSAEAIFAVLIEPEQLERWMASKANVEPVIGGHYDIGWPGFGPLKVLDLKTGERLALSWPGDEGDTVVTWTLEGSGDRTTLTLVHSGFAPDRNTSDIYAGWLNFASWVKSAVEYGRQWATPVIRLREDQYAFYPGTVSARQREIRWVTPRPASAPLGSYCEIQSPVADAKAAIEFYEALGFEPVADDVMTDGNINLRLVPGAGWPTLAYAGSSAEYFTDPAGLRVTVSSLPATDGRGAGNLNSPPRALCGKFGELALPCPDVRGTAAFWQQFGFKLTLLEDSPYPWAILTDGHMVLGLHQTEDFSEPHLTYFAPNMADRIAQLTQRGLAIRELDGRHGALRSGLAIAPGGQRVFLFTGEA